jgi:sensor histidine kinase YesM
LHAADINDPERKHSGIGLKNVKERLVIFYEGRHELKCEETDKEFIVELIIEPKNTLS